MSRSKVEQKEQKVESFSDSEFANLTSKQTWDILTNLLFAAAKPLAKDTNFILDICFLLITSTTDQRRRPTILSHDKCLVDSVYLMFIDPEQALSVLIFDMGMERSIISNYIQDYLENAYTPKMYSDASFSPEALYRHTRDAYDLYLSFREEVCRRFIKLSNSHASKNKWSKDKFGLYSDLEDNENTYFLSVLKAIDKLYPTKGTLTNYVIQWLGNAAGSTYTLYTGEAYSLTRPVRQAVHEGQLTINNKAYSLEKAFDIPIEDEILEKEETKNLTSIFAYIQSIPDVSFIHSLYGIPITATPALNQQLQAKLKLEGYPSTFGLSNPEIDDLPELRSLQRSSRRDKETGNA